MRGYECLKAEKIKIGDEVIINGEGYSSQFDSFHTYEKIRKKIIDITTLPNGGYYFIFGKNRDSVYIAPGKEMYKKISLKDIFKKL